RVQVDQSRDGLVALVESLQASLERREFRELRTHDFKAIAAPQHLYEPLLVVETGAIEVTPAPLNPGEFRFVEDLTRFAQTNPATLAGTTLFFLRNLSRGKGIGFIEADNFHPDFILWMVQGPRQRVLFIDPKGIRNLEPDDAKIAFHRTVKEIEAR